MRRTPAAHRRQTVYAQLARLAARPYRTPVAPAGQAAAPVPAAGPALHLQRALGNRAVVELVTGGAGRNVIRRAPMVHDLVTGQVEDAADWNVDRIDAWLAQYNEAMSFVRRDYNADFNALSDLRKTDRIQDQARERDDPRGHTFDREKRSLVRDEERIAAANATIDLFAQQEYAAPALDFNKETVVAELRAVVADPAMMDQKGYPLCGPDTYLRMYAVHHPDAYVRFVIDLLTTGSGTLGAQTVTAPATVREKNLWSGKMRIGEWVASASLRIASNKGGHHTIHQGRHNGSRINPIANLHALIAGATTLKEMQTWLQQADPNLPVTMESHMATRTPPAIVDRINEAFKAGQAVALMINDDIVDNTYDRKIPSVNVGGHLVLLASDILAPGDGSNYLAEVLTWGAKKRIVFRRDQLGKAILGYVAADLAEFNANPNNANPGNLANPNGDQAAPAAL